MTMRVHVDYTGCLLLLTSIFLLRVSVMPLLSTCHALHSICMAVGFSLLLEIFFLYRKGATLCVHVCVCMFVFSISSSW